MIRRVSDLASDVRRQVARHIHNYKYFSLAMDESTYISEIAQVAVFIRSLNDEFELITELLGLESIHETTKGSDLLETKALHNLTVFVQIVQQLYGQTIWMCGVVEKVSWSPSFEISFYYSPGSIVLRDIKFEACHGCGTELCQQNKRQNTELKRVQTISKYPAKCEFVVCDDWLNEMAFCIDITSHLNALNVNLQGKKKLFTDLCHSLKQKNGRILHIFSPDRPKSQLTLDSIEKRARFNESDTEHDNVVMCTNPYVFPNDKICLLEPNLQQEVIEVRYRCVIISNFMDIPACEQSFSTMNLIKNKQRSRRIDDYLVVRLTLAVANLNLDIDRLVSEHALITRDNANTN
ncbi:hypothetical protein RF11_03483 [Thelohanellus kitauei]|uniref:HAT C-terminal dimerisation domain-containing protein n=1 Tax=Thelohanellus kitauei TaxID=669202 RepID=A0A0C2IBI0_THEKT|nr:hypothetical protein RF11_03483 [Thelohanellus kitauei]